MGTNMTLSWQKGRSERQMFININRCIAGKNNTQGSITVVSCA